MRAMIVTHPAPIETSPLQFASLPVPQPLANQIRIKTEVCGVCLTDLHVVEGDLPFHGLVIPGHQAIGMVDSIGDEVTQFHIGDRAGAAWLHETCNICSFCESQRENLCAEARFTGYDANGGYAEYTLIPAEYAYPIPKTLDPASAAPLLCAGIIGYRAFRISGIEKGGRLGLYGFGASAHITIQIALHLGCEVYVFTRSKKHQELAAHLGAAWVGRAKDTPPHKLNASIIFAPAGPLVPEALRVLERGGKLALAGIHMSSIPELHYADHLYQEKSIQSVTNNTREDGKELLRLAEEIPVKTHTQTYPLEKANQVLQKLKRGEINGAAVLEL